MLKYINKFLNIFKNRKIINFGTSKAKLIEIENDDSTIFEKRFLEFLGNNKEELSLCLHRYGLSNYNRLNGLIDLINLWQSKVKQ